MLFVVKLNACLNFRFGRKHELDQGGEPIVQIGRLTGACYVYRTVAILRTDSPPKVHRMDGCRIGQIEDENERGLIGRQRRRARGQIKVPGRFRRKKALRLRIRTKPERTYRLPVPTHVSVCLGFE